MVVPSNLWVADWRDTIWINFSLQVGDGMLNEHPMMVLSPKAFNKRTNLFTGLSCVNRHKKPINLSEIT